MCLSVGSQLAFEAHFTSAEHAIGLDSISYQGENSSAVIESRQCPVVSCNFENGDCGWRRHGSYSTWAVEEDYSTLNGKKLFRANISESQISRVSTFCLTLKDATTFSFEYAVRSKTLSKLRLLMESNLGIATQATEQLWVSKEGRKQTARLGQLLVSTKTRSESKFLFQSLNTNDWLGLIRKLIEIVFWNLISELFWSLQVPP